MTKQIDWQKNTRSWWYGRCDVGVLFLVWHCGIGDRYELIVMGKVAMRGKEAACKARAQELFDQILKEDGNEKD